MSIIALALNLTLGGLMLAALGLGWRLDRRLKSLRDSHASFAKAVDDLDRAAIRAEQGLADLRAATDEAAETLAGRIERAKSLAVRLETALDRAPAPAPAQPRPQELRPLRADLILEDAPRPRPAAPMAPSDRPLPNPFTASPRSRARLDDDLFDERPPLRAAAGGRR